MSEKMPMSPAGQKQALQRRTVRKPAIHKPTVDHSKAQEKLDQPQSASSIKPAVPALTHIEPDALNLALLKAQLQLRASSQNVKQPQPGKSLLILVGGIELAGKGEAVIQLREWMDPRYLKVKASLSKPLASNQPFWQDYVDAIPACGQIAVLFGNWYGDLLYSGLHESQFNTRQFQQAVLQMREFEQDLAANGVTVIKCWFDISWNCLQQRLNKLDASARQWQQLHGLDWRDQQQYRRIQRLRKQFTDDWFIINGENSQQRDLEFGHLVLDASNTALPVPQIANCWQQASIPAMLLKPAQQKLEKQQYNVELAQLQQQVAQLLRQYMLYSSVVIVFEGMDAAGKGGAIKRVVAPLDPREYEIHSIAAPDSFEKRHPYLWRFWTRLPRPGGMTIFDRSWYGRVLVERVESFASNAEWQRAYDEINHFEQQLSDSGILVIKFWLGISEKEQLKRFQAREVNPHKQYKITDEDWRNRKKWQQYLEAAADMLQRTDSSQAPWAVIATNDKKTARIAVLSHMVNQLEERLKTMTKSLRKPKPATQQPDPANANQTPVAHQLEE
ncbi:phosphate--AMP phosphotransferase [Alkanindiges illinoisensis]|uniref:phosphate--AMP phosphotransferase n=1 Tax=Alkanindiges illinoisensis TaxID=197183 RepID=UPI000B20C63B|nr:phosphate--AMP phosphotransferase [Alkanindiges illinoisensis]